MNSGRRRRRRTARRILNFFERARERVLQLSLDDIWQFLHLDCGRRRLYSNNGSRRRWRRSDLGAFTSITQSTEMLSDLVGNIVLERAGMRLLLHPKLFQKVQYEVTLDLQLARQYVNSYVTHSVCFITLPQLPPVSRRTG